MQLETIDKTLQAWVGETVYLHIGGAESYITSGVLSKNEYEGSEEYAIEGNYFTVYFLGANVTAMSFNVHDSITNSSLRIVLRGRVV